MKAMRLKTKNMPTISDKLPSILVCDRYIVFREGLKNFLLASGYTQVDVVETMRAALTKLHHEKYGYVLIGLSPPFLAGQRLARVAQRRQPEAKIFYLVSAQDQPYIKDTSFESVIKEYVCSNLSGLL